jgi:hypothetical protein
MEVSGQLHAHFTPERNLDTHWIGGWVGPKAGLDTMSKRKIPIPLQESNAYPLNCSACIQPLYQLSYPSFDIYTNSVSFYQFRTS